MFPPSAALPRLQKTGRARAPSARVHVQSGSLSSAAELSVVYRNLGALVNAKGVRREKRKKNSLDVSLIHRDGSLSCMVARSCLASKAGSYATRKAGRVQTRHQAIQSWPSRPDGSGGALSLFLVSFVFTIPLEPRFGSLTQWRPQQAESRHGAVQPHWNPVCERIRNAPPTDFGERRPLPRQIS